MSALPPGVLPPRGPALIIGWNDLGFAFAFYQQ